jgi:hypothetical protein
MSNVFREVCSRYSPHKTISPRMAINQMIPKIKKKTDETRCGGAHL